MSNKSESANSSKECNGMFYMETNNKADDGDEVPSAAVNNKRDNKLSNGDDKTELGSDHSSPNNDHKRQKPIQSSPVCALSVSPPNFVSFEEIMKTANEISRMALVNEIVHNKDFKLEKKEETNLLQKAVRENMQKAFWEILSEQLSETPPNYKQAISLVCDIKETLLFFLMPQHTQLKNEINEILDIDLIKQQADNGIFEFQRYAQYVLSVCSRLCCPARDEMIRELTQKTEVVPLFKGIFELLETMRLDFANFYIKQFRPHIQLASVEYERDKFTQLIKTHQKYQMDVLEYTAKWLKRNYESLDLSNENDAKNIFNKILWASYIDLLKCISSSFSCCTVNKDDQSNDKENIEDDYPETMLLVRNRIECIREKIYKSTLISSIFVVTFAAIGEPLQSIKEFRAKLKNELNVIIQSNDEKQIPLHYLKSDELKSILTSAALQVIKSIGEALVEYNANSVAEPSNLNSPKFESLKLQISDLALSNNRIRSVMERRILEFIERVISSATAVPIQVPTGLSSFSTELTQIGGEFTRLVTYNRAVYSPYYTKIIAQITAPMHLISQSELKEIEKSFYN